MMIVSAIVATGKNGEIGKNNDLLWHLPADMRYFKKTTIGHTIITGRKSYTSIPEKYRPLPERVNIVVTRQKELQLEGASVVNSITEGIELAKNNHETEVFIIGGGEIYKQAIEQGLINRLYITKVDARFDADTFFPNINMDDWNLVSEENRTQDEKNKFDLSFCIYELKE